MATKTQPAVPAKSSDLEMMLDPSRWPMWPILPLKRKQDGQRITAVLGIGPRGYQFFRGANMWADPQTWGEAEIRTPEGLIEEGWEVD